MSYPPDINSPQQDDNPDGLSVTVADSGAGFDWNKALDKANGLLSQMLDFNLKSKQIELTASNRYGQTTSTTGGVLQQGQAHQGNGQLLTLAVYGLAIFAVFKLLEEKKG